MTTRTPDARNDNVTRTPATAALAAVDATRAELDRVNNLGADDDSSERDAYTGALEALAEAVRAGTGPDPQAEAEAVLDVLAPWHDTGIPGIPRVRVPLIGVDYDGTYIRPSDEHLTALARQIVTAIRTANSPVR